MGENINGNNVLVSLHSFSFPLNLLSFNFKLDGLVRHFVKNGRDN